MKKLGLLLLILTFAVTSFPHRAFTQDPQDVRVAKVNLQKEVEWGKYDGRVKDNKARSIRYTTDGGYILDDSTHTLIKTPDGGYVVSGWDKETIRKNGRKDVWVAKVNRLKELEWEYYYGGNNDDKALSIQYTADGGYILAGYTESFGKGKKDVWVIKLNGSGKKEWAKAFGGEGNDEARDVIQTSDGGYLVGGYTASFPLDKKSLWVLKLDKAGNLEWKSKVEGSKPEMAYSVSEASDGGYTVGGYLKKFGKSTKNTWIIKLSKTGSFEWRKWYRIKAHGKVHTVRATSDGGLIVTGHMPSHSGVWATKLNPLRLVDWEVTMDNSRFTNVHSITEVASNSFLLTVCNHNTSSTIEANNSAEKLVFWEVELPVRKVKLHESKTLEGQI